MLCRIDLAPGRHAGLYPGAFVRRGSRLNGLPRPLLRPRRCSGKAASLVALVEGRKVHVQRVRPGR